VTDRVEPQELQESFDRMAELLLFRQRLSEDPRGALEQYEVAGIPPAAMEVLAAMSPEELELFARVQTKLGRIPGEIPGGREVCLIF
jgi:hypothetical protein